MCNGGKVNKSVFIVGFSMEYICPDCIDDEYLSSYISDNGEKGVCSYCGNEGDNVLYMDTLLEVIRAAVRSEYDHPENGLGWDKGWIEPSKPVYDSYDLVHDVLCLGGSKAVDDIELHFFDELWCKKEFYGYSDEEKMWYTWEAFKRQVCHHSRYLFLVDSTELESQLEYKTPAQILNTLEAYVNEFNLISTLEEGAFLFRARASKKNNRFTTAKELGPPRPDEAIYSNRFSPAGIPMFYSSEDPETCIEEIGSEKCTISLSKWKVLKDLNIIDFTELFYCQNGNHIAKYFPSFYETEKQNERIALSFLSMFANDLIKPISKDGQENIEYVPTQIVVEFFRRVYNKKHAIDGFCYYSSKNNKKNYVLFIEQRNCIKLDTPLFEKDQVISLVSEYTNFILHEVKTDSQLTE
jgi:hypothetical protein